MFLKAPPLQTRLPSVEPRFDEHAASVGVATDEAPSSPAPMAERLPMLRAVGQVGTTYVVAEGPDGMYLVDQHAAHERALYERFLLRAAEGQPEAQLLLEPLTIELSASHQALLLEHGDAFARIGFDVEPFGDAAFVVRAVPAAISDDVARRITELLDRMQRDDASYDGPDDMWHRAAASLACHASVRAGMSMSAEEQRELLRGLAGCAAPRTCPHGRPTVVHLAADAIAREFRRR
jgi:DNA mismatch repair protein MutL